jgi:hypothetical protein
MRYGAATTRIQRPADKNVRLGLSKDIQVKIARREWPSRNLSSIIQKIPKGYPREGGSYGA